MLQTGTTPNQALKPAENDVFETCSLWMKTCVSVRSTSFQHRFLLLILYENRTLLADSYLILRD